MRFRLLFVLVVGTFLSACGASSTSSSPTTPSPTTTTFQAPTGVIASASVPIHAASTMADRARDAILSDASLGGSRTYSECADFQKTGVYGQVWEIRLVQNPSCNFRKAILNVSGGPQLVAYWGAIRVSVNLSQRRGTQELTSGEPELLNSSGKTGYALQYGTCIVSSHNADGSWDFSADNACLATITQKQNGHVVGVLGNFSVPFAAHVNPAATSF